MKRLLFCLLMTSGLVYSDDHINKEPKKNLKEKFMNNPNYLMNFKECKEVKDGVGGLLALSEEVWKEIENNPENKEQWAKAGFLAEMAANYSKVYDVWCKDMVDKRVKMRYLGKKKDKKKG